jgi:hypothetical protein
MIQKPEKGRIGQEESKPNPAFGCNHFGVEDIFLYGRYTYLTHCQFYFFNNVCYD